MSHAYARHVCRLEAVIMRGWHTAIAWFCMDTCICAVEVCLSGPMGLHATALQNL